MLYLARASLLPNSDGFLYPILAYIEFDEALTMSVVAVYLEAQFDHDIPHLPDFFNAKVISYHLFDVTFLGSFYSSDAPLKTFVYPCLWINLILGILGDDILGLPVNAIRSPDVG